MAQAFALLTSYQEVVGLIPIGSGNIFSRRVIIHQQIPVSNSLAYSDLYREKCRVIHYYFSYFFFFCLTSVIFALMYYH